MNENNVNFLENWFWSQCNEDWEHLYGIKIDTLDNPGWLITIDLEDTEYVNKLFSEIDIQRKENDWIQCKIEEGKFIGAGGPFNLNELIQIFRNWTNSP